MTDTKKLEEYRQISADVWGIFKRYLPKDANAAPFADDVHDLDTKYKGTDGYQFMQKLLKVYFDELNRMKG